MALRIICRYGVCDTDIICVALLHDSVEDHAADLAADGRSGAFAVLADEFSSEAATAQPGVAADFLASERFKLSAFAADLPIVLRPV